METAVIQLHHRANDPVRDALERLGAVVRREDADGIDFYLGDMAGFARARRGRLRTSYFLEVGSPDPLSIEMLISGDWQSPHARLDLADVKDGVALRFLVELPFDATAEIRATAQEAQALHFAWRNRRDAESNLTRTLGAAGIAFPPGTARRTFYSYGAWSWGSRYLAPQDMYMFERVDLARRLAEHGGFFALSHAGHGLNSYGLNLVTAKGPVAAFVQHGYGGVYTDPVRALIDINTTYSKLHVLLSAIDESAEARPRWLLAYSSFRFVAELIDLDEFRDGSTLEDATVSFDSESELFAAVVERLELDDDAFGGTGRVSW